MPGFDYTSLSRTLLATVGLSLLFMAPASVLRAGELTGLPQDDPQDLLPAPTPVAPTPGRFQPMPGWTHFASMPPLPDQLKPLGKRLMVASITAPLATLPPPKDTPPAASSPTPQPPKPASVPQPVENPALVAVSPFLQWIKDNPQTAAADAKKQAGSYQSSAVVPSNGKGTSSGADPYWLPPLLNSSESSPPVIGGSAAIYQTPQR